MSATFGIDPYYGVRTELGGRAKPHYQWTEKGPRQIGLTYTYFSFVHNDLERKVSFRKDLNRAERRLG